MSPVAASAPHNPRRREIVTPEGLALPFTVASRGARAAALLLDFLLLYGSLFVFLMLLLWTLGGAIESVGEALGGAAEFLLVLAFLAFFLARYGYFLAFELGPRGATPGKRVLGIRIAARDGGRLTAEAVIARNLLRDIELFMPLVFIVSAPSGAGGAAGVAALAWFLVFMLFPFFNRDAMRAGDLIAGTWVVEMPRARLPETLSASGAAAEGKSALTGAAYRFGEEELSIYGEHELKVLERVLRTGREEELETVAEAICRKIGWAPGSGDERAFLEAFYAQLRARLESGMHFGRRKKDKYS